VITGFFAFNVLLGVNALEFYLNTTEKYFKKAEKEFDEKYENDFKRLLLEEGDNAIDYYNELAWDYSYTLPNIMRNSFFVALFSFLEHKLGIFCKYMQKERKIVSSWQDEKGNTLDKFKKYCKHNRLSLKFDDQNWQEINHYRLIRNCIVHNKGLIKGFNNEKELRDYNIKRMIISQDTIEEEIALSEQFCKEAVITIRNYLYMILNNYHLQYHGRLVVE
jgi:hypothetical protein